MGRSHGSAYPPINDPGDGRLLRSGMGETDWSIQPTLVDEKGIHTCHCESCIEIRKPRPLPPEELADIEEMIREDEAEQAHRRAARYESPGLKAWRAKNFPPKEAAG